MVSERDHRAVILGREDLDAIVAVLGTSFTAEAAWDLLMAHVTPAGFVDPAWRKHVLAAEFERSHIVVIPVVIP